MKNISLFSFIILATLILTNIDTQCSEAWSTELISSIDNDKILNLEPLMQEIYGDNNTIAINDLVNVSDIDTIFSDIIEATANQISNINNVNITLQQQIDKITRSSKFIAERNKLERSSSLMDTGTASLGEQHTRINNIEDIIRHNNLTNNKWNNKWNAWN